MAKAKNMNPLQSYIHAVEPLTEPYLALVGAYAEFLQSLGSGQSRRKGTLDKVGTEAEVASPTEVSAAENAGTESKPKRTISHRAAVARANKAWETRRANAAKAKKAARSKARSRVH